jgi:tetratricopeptide (TPR) repeat protein
VVAIRRAHRAKEAFNSHQFATSKELYARVCQHFPRIRPCVSYYFLAAGARLHREHRDQKAIELLKIATLFDNHNRKAYRILGDIFLESGDYQKSKNYYTKAIGKL